MKMGKTSGLGSGWMATCATCGAEFRAYSYRSESCSEDCRFKRYQSAGEPGICWEWKGPRSAEGYGVMFLQQNKPSGRRAQTTAHRYSFVRSGGQLTDEKPCVLHRCDNRACTNPAHLFAGDRDDNNKDRSTKGRSGQRAYTKAERQQYSIMLRGSGNPSAKLTDAQARAIKREHPELTNAAVGAMYGVSKSAAGLIRLGKNWSHV